MAEKVKAYWKDERRKQVIRRICEIIEDEEDVVPEGREQEG